MKYGTIVVLANYITKYSVSYDGRINIGRMGKDSVA